MPGLYRDKRSGVYYINKQIRRLRIHHTTGERSRAKAEIVLEALVRSVGKPDAPGVITFRHASIRHLLTTTRIDIEKDAGKLSKLFPYLADKPVETIDHFSLQAFLDSSDMRGKKCNTRNSYLALVRLILRRAAREWKKEDGTFWLRAIPYIPMEKVRDARQPYPISWAEQRLLFPHLADHLHHMALFMTNTGLRDNEICNLRWSYFRRLHGSEIRYFLIPAENSKNGQSRVVVLNSVCEGIINRLSPARTCDHVFTYQGRSLVTMRNDGWLNAVTKASRQYESVFGVPCPTEFRRLRIHDLRHTVGRRLRAVDVPDLEIASILGHNSGRQITAHYADGEIARLHTHLEKITQPGFQSSPTLRIVASSSITSVQ